MKKILFYPLSEEIQAIVPPPKPAITYAPDWYKKTPKFENNIFKVNVLPNGTTMANATMKSCIPFLDSLTTGYIQETWCDILIEKEGHHVVFKYSGSPGIIEVREKLSSDKMIDDHFYPIEFIWLQPWTPKLPQGWSMLYTHPLNRNDLPFESLSGIIDNDTFYSERKGNYPFFIKKDFIGIIPAGTPMFQMIPIKRENWQSVAQKHTQEFKWLSQKVSRYFYDGYKKIFWNKKIYK
jgi:hypothetical protein